MLQTKDRIQVMTELGRLIKNRGGDQWEAVIQKAYIYNKWFTPENIRLALDALSERFLTEETLTSWLAPYSLPDHPAKEQCIGIVMAGNIPLVGFHDLLCVFMSGHKAMFKLSEKDNVLLPFLLELLKEINPRTEEYLQVVEKLSRFDAVIATGSDNSSRYFEAYFGKYPHIIRKNRNAIAVLNGQESDTDLLALGKDVFQYFGLGCRSVSKLYVPLGYGFETLLTAMHEYREIVLHDKYKNNFDYNYTLLILNQVPHLANGCILLTEDKAIPSRIASLHYEYYHDPVELPSELQIHKSDIQCIVSQSAWNDLPVVPFGKAQQPGLMDYADGVDTLAFLLGL